MLAHHTHTHTHTHTHRYAFFQPPDNDIVIMLHFHLHNGLMIGKKQYKDIQFYIEVGEVSTDLSKRMGAHEREEIEAEHRERAMRSRTKKMFKSFMEKVGDRRFLLYRVNAVLFFV